MQLLFLNYINIYLFFLFGNYFNINYVIIYYYYKIYSYDFFLLKFIFKCDCPDFCKNFYAIFKCNLKNFIVEDEDEDEVNLFLVIIEYTFDRFYYFIISTMTFYKIFIK